MGTVIGALAAIGGLVFTAVATYYSAAVSDDQLQESRQAADRAERAQAARVSFWVDTESGDRRLHVFRDRNGKAWQRTEVALNPIGHGVPPVDGTTYVAGKHGAEVHDAPDCGDDTG
ncbi:hypothetical protein [Streptomyces diastatochromogenes]|uniref:hypothetical protein n=1 Tax=Streptomyces diastatochromogenes TaxID=42236 RepID=UPI003685A3C7